MAAWAQHALGRLRRLGIGVATVLEEDRDATRAVFVHGEGHGEIPARLFVAVGPEGLDVALEIPPAGLAEVFQRLGDRAGVLELEAALHALPEQFTLRVTGEPERPQVSQLSGAQGLAVVERAVASEMSVGIGWTLARAVALEHAEGLDDQVEDALVALALTVMPLAWTPVMSDGGAGRARWFSEKGASPGPRRTRLRKNRKDPDADTETDTEAERDGTAEREASGQPSVRFGDPWIPSPHVGGRAPHRHASAARPTIGPGARVRVLEGPFAGRTGVVQEVDGKGGARVMLGLLAVRVIEKDLAILSRAGARPRLSSSHRRPSPVRS